ncbi:MAG: glycosyltransferase family 2 protein [Candidatus Sumerlaeaceae bacterium]
MNALNTIDVSVVIPAYNEEASIGGVVNGVRAVMEAAGIDYELLVVDDCSTDETRRIADEAGARVVSHAMNLGSGAARRTGVQEARGEIVVMLDGDGTYEPRTIPEMLSYFPQYDQVNGARTSEQGTLRPLRSGAKTLIRWLAIYLAGRNIPDLNTGLKAFKRSIMLKYLWVLPDGFSCVTTMTLAFLTNGHPVKYVSTPYYKRAGGRSKFHPLRDTAKYLSTVVRVATYFRPLRVYGPLALITVAVGVLKSCYDFFIHAKHSLEESDIIIICTGILLAAIGLLADLIVAQRRR